MSPNEDPATLPYRVRKLEEHQDELRTKTIPDLLSHGKEWHAALMMKMADLDRQLVQLDRRLDERFAPRREAEQRHGVVNERFESQHEWIRENKERIDRLEKAAWGLAIAVLIVALGAWVRTGAPH